MHLHKQSLSGPELRSLITVAHCFNICQSDFTEGLEFHPKSGMLVECTGIKRSSGVKLLQPAVDDSPSNTLGGAIGKAPELVASQNLEDKYFGEGCTVFNDKLWVLPSLDQRKSKSSCCHNARTKLTECFMLLLVADLNSPTRANKGLFMMPLHLSAYLAFRLRQPLAKDGVRLMLWCNFAETTAWVSRA